MIYVLLRFEYFYDKVVVTQLIIHQVYNIYMHVFRLDSILFLFFVTDFTLLVLNVYHPCSHKAR